MSRDHAPASANFLGSSFDILLGVMFLIALLVYQAGSLTLSPAAYEQKIPADFYKDFQTVENSDVINPEIIADFEMMMNLENDAEQAHNTGNIYVPGEPQHI